MATLNKVTLIGYLGHNPEIRYTASGDPVAHVNLATTETWKDKATGERKEATEWHRIVLYRKLAEIVGQYLKKGSHVYIEGRLQTRKWTAKDGTERHTTEVIADDMRMLGSRHDSSHGGEDRDAQPQTKPAHAADLLPEDAIPF